MAIANKGRDTKDYILTRTQQEMGSVIAITKQSERLKDLSEKLAHYAADLATHSENVIVEGYPNTTASEEELGCKLANFLLIWKSVQQTKANLLSLLKTNTTEHLIIQTITETVNSIAKRPRKGESP